MKLRLPSLLFVSGAVLSLALLLSVSPVCATSALYLSDVEQAAQSTAVVVASIGESKVGLHPQWKRPITTTTVHVQEVILGKAPQQLTIEQLGGTIDGKTLHIPGDASFRRGERCVLFLRQLEGEWFLTAMQQSKYELREERRGTFLRRSLSAGLFVWGRDGLQPYQEPPTRPVSTLDDFRTRLRRALPERGARR